MPKPFPPNVIVQAWRRSGGKCECTKTTCGHALPHGKRLELQDRRNRGSGFGWEVHHIDATAEPTIGNCAVVCMECRKN